MKRTIAPTVLRPTLITILFAVCFCINPCLLSATIRYVKPVAVGTGNGSNWANASSDLQGIINASGSGDEVWVAAGTYPCGSGQSYAMKEGVKIYGGFAGTETLLSQRNWTVNVTTLQGNGNRVVTNSNNGLTNAAELDGFTITNGNVAASFGFGGGMYNSLVSPRITNCRFSGNSAYGGGGMYNANATPIISGCTFSGNSASFGGGMYNSGNLPTIISSSFNSNSASQGGGMYNMNLTGGLIDNCSFSANAASGQGGGMFNTNAAPLLRGTTFSGNLANQNTSTGSGYGAGVYNEQNSTGTFTGCSFTNNIALRYGAGMSNLNSACFLSNCSFSGNSAQYAAALFNNNGSNTTSDRCSFLQNTATSDGGAVYIIFSDPVFTNCLFSGNTAQNWGGALIISNGALPVFNGCLVSGNKANISGGAVYALSGGTVATFNNCTIACNNGPGSSSLLSTTSATTNINNSIVWGNNSSIANSGGTTNVQYSIVQGGYPGTGNQNSDPFFYNAPAYNTAPYTNGDFRVSGCVTVNTGNNALVPAGLTTDLGGRPRINGVTVDIGAYEGGLLTGAGNILYVNSSAPPGSNGSGDSWNNAIVYLSVALQYAKQNESQWTAANPLKIFVAKGNQTPISRPDNACGAYSFVDRNNSFLLVNNVQIYGGFDPANGIDDLSDTRIFGAGGTILSGDMGTSGNNSDNTYHVITSSGMVNNVIVDGFTITGGNANGAGSITANGNSIPNNNGGGIYHYASAPSYVNCTISGNNASNWGGGIYAALAPAFTLNSSTITSNTASAGAGIFNDGSSPAITGCSITNNNAPFGGAIYNSGGAPAVLNTSFSGNQSASYGGAVYNSGASASYTNCTFTNNSTVNGTGGGGAIFNNAATPVITNCSFTGNNGDYGGSIYNYSNSVSTIIVCTFTTNTAGYGGAMYSEIGTSAVVYNSRFLGNTSSYGGAFFNSGIATVSGCSFFNNQAVSYGGAAYNNSAGIASSYTNCVFASNSSSSGGGAVFNNGSLPAITNCTFWGNSAPFGGAIHNWATAVANIRNSVIWGNSSSIHNESAASASVQNSIVQGGYAGTGNLITDPLFINTFLPAGADGVWGTIDDGLRVLPCSPAINAGNNAAIPGGITTDASATPRIQFATVDAGAYEMNSLADNNAATIAATNTTATAWQLPNAKTFYATNCSTLIASVTGDGMAASINGNTTVKVWIEASQPAQYVKRHYEITPQDVPASTARATITLYFTQAEFDAFNAVNTTKLPQGPSDAAGKANLLVEKRSGSSNNGTGVPASYTGAVVTINPNDAAISWNAIASRWEISFPVTGFSGFFVKTQSFTLPLRLVSFLAAEHNCITTLQWITKDEVNVSHFEVEQSTDGVLFNTVETVPARNTGTENNYAVDLPVANDRMFYRLKMVDIDGRITYSRVIVITSVCGNRVLVSPNPAHDKLYISNASVGSQYAIYDNTGKRISSGRISNAVQEVSIIFIAQGIYYISVTDKNGSSSKASFLKD